MTTKFEWILNNFRKEKIILAQIWATIFFREVPLPLDVRHCPKLQSCAILRKTNDATLRNTKNPNFGPIWGPKNLFHGFYLY